MTGGIYIQRPNDPPHGFLEEFPMLALRRTVPVILTLLAACTEPTATTPKDPPYKKPSDVNVIIVAPNSPRQIIANPESDVKSLPSVRVYNTTVDNPVAGATVLFTLRNLDGSTAKTFSVTTSSDGIATLPSWHVGGIGRYVANAYVAGFNSVDFTAWVRGKVIGIYDLIALEGTTFPSNYVTEAHYVLFEDGSYNHVYNMPVNENTVFDKVSGTYTKDSTGVIAFYLDPANASSLFGNLYSEARPYNGKLRVTYTDYIDFDIEIYTPR